MYKVFKKCNIIGVDLFVTYAYSGRICPLESFIVFSNHYMLKARK